MSFHNCDLSDHASELSSETVTDVGDSNVTTDPSSVEFVPNNDGDSKVTTDHASDQSDTGIESIGLEVADSKHSASVSVDVAVSGDWSSLKSPRQRATPISLHEGMKILCSELGVHKVEDIELTCKTFLHMAVTQHMTFDRVTPVGSRPETLKSEEKVVFDLMHRSKATGYEVESTSTDGPYTITKCKILEPYISFKVTIIKGIGPDEKKVLEGLREKQIYEDFFGLPVVLAYSPKERLLIVADLGESTTTANVRIVLEDICLRGKCTGRTDANFEINTWNSKGMLIFDMIAYLKTRGRILQDASLLQGTRADLTSAIVPLAKKVRSLPNTAGGIMEVCPFEQMIMTEGQVRNLSTSIIRLNTKGMMEELKKTILNPKNEVKILQIPSDTGLVFLTSDCYLIAATSIAPGELITAIPCTECVNLYRPLDGIRFSCNGKELFPLKRSIPLGGFGGFARFTRNQVESNSEVRKVSEDGSYLNIVATKDISFKDDIVTYTNNLLVMEKEVVHRRRRRSSSDSSSFSCTAASSSASSSSASEPKRCNYGNSSS